MIKQQESTFRSKFRLLNSQENNEDIKWSSSESSDYDNNNRNNSLTNKIKCRKRKRKSKVPKNLSNLDVTIIDVQKEPDELASPKKSPIISKKDNKKTITVSPILKSSPLYFPPYKCTNTTSPIINTCKMTSRSPILTQKPASPKVVKSKKKLFTNADKKPKNNVPTKFQQTSSVLLSETGNTFDDIERNTLVPENKDNSSVITSEATKIKLEDEKKQLTVKKEDSLCSDTNTSLDDSLAMQKSCKSVELKDQIKSFFNSHFSSQSLSQHSITETQTPVEDTKLCDEIEIPSSSTIKSRTSFESIKSEPLSKPVSPMDSFESNFVIDRSKKIKYKKDSLAYRLHALVKKQNASVSLWQHEKYLAENSSFVIPKGEETVFHIRKVNFKYGCYLLETMDTNNVNFLIVINSHLSNCNFYEDAIFKLYQPFTVLDLNVNQKLITNACKFECIPFL